MYDHILNVIELILFLSCVRAMKGSRKNNDPNSVIDSTTRLDNRFLLIYIEMHPGTVILIISHNRSMNVYYCT